MYVNYAILMLSQTSSVLQKDKKPRCCQGTVRPRLKMSHEGTAQVRHFQTRVIIFECRMNDRASSVLLIGSMGPDFVKTSQAVAEI